jgi:hypothetical protein
MKRRITTNYTEREMKYWTAIVFIVAYLSGIFAGCLIAGALP